MKRKKNNQILMRYNLTTATTKKSNEICNCIYMSIMCVCVIRLTFFISKTIHIE